MVRKSRQDADAHDAETRLYAPVQQSADDDNDRTDLVISQPTYPTNVNVAPGNYGDSSYSSRTRAVARLNSVIRLLFALLEALIAIRFALKAMGASASAPFATFIYGITGPFVAPFVGVVPEPSYSQYVAEFPSLLAIIIYFLLSLLITRLLHVLFIDQPRV